MRRPSASRNCLPARSAGSNRPRATSFLDTSWFKVQRKRRLGLDAWSSLSGGHTRFRAGMTFEPKKDTPARRPSLPAERLLHDAHANSVPFDVTLYYDPNTKNGV